MTSGCRPKAVHARSRRAERLSADASMTSRRAERSLFRIGNAAVNADFRAENPRASTSTRRRRNCSPASSPALGAAPARGGLYADHIIGVAHVRRPQDQFRDEARTTVPPASPIRRAARRFRTPGNWRWFPDSRIPGRPRAAVRHGLQRPAADQHPGPPHRKCSRRCPAWTRSFSMPCLAPQRAAECARCAEAGWRCSAPPSRWRPRKAARRCG